MFQFHTASGRNIDQGSWKDTGCGFHFSCTTNTARAGSRSGHRVLHSKDSIAVVETSRISRTPQVPDDTQAHISREGSGLEWQFLCDRNPARCRDAHTKLRTVAPAWE